MINVYDRLEELAASGSRDPGLSTGLHDLDRKISGLNKTDLILITDIPVWARRLSRSISA